MCHLPVQNSKHTPPQAEQNGAQCVSQQGTSSASLKTQIGLPIRDLVSAAGQLRASFTVQSSCSFPGDAGAAQLLAPCF